MWLALHQLRPPQLWSQCKQKGKLTELQQEDEPLLQYFNSSWSNQASDVQLGSPYYSSVIHCIFISVRTTPSFSLPQMSLVEIEMHQLVLYIILGCRYRMRIDFLFLFCNPCKVLLKLVFNDIPLWVPVSFLCVSVSFLCVSVSSLSDFNGSIWS